MTIATMAGMILAARVRVGGARRWQALLLLGVCAAVCASAAQARQTRLASEVIAAEDINPNRRGTPQPVKLHIFYLAQSDAFLQADFMDLIDPATGVLGEELVRRVERLVGPGERIELDESFDEAARFIGVVAEFTEVGEASWRALEEVPARRWRDVLRLFRSNKLEIRLEGVTVSCAIVEG